MKKTIYALVAALGIFAFASCGDEEHTDTRLTSYVTFELTGGENYALPVGTAYKEPGFRALEGESDVSASVKVDGDVDGTKVGFYPVSYSATNVDGFASSVTRNVFVYDPEVGLDISGQYTVQPGSHRMRQGTRTGYDGQKVTLVQVAPGMFSITDWIGGYYDQRAGYGASYALKGYLGLNSDNSITGLYGHLAGWGDSFTSVEGSYDPATGTLSMTVGYAGMDFHVILNK